MMTVHMWLERDSREAAALRTGSLPGTTLVEDAVRRLLLNTEN